MRGRVLLFPEVEGALGWGGGYWSERLRPTSASLCLVLWGCKDPTTLTFPSGEQTYRIEGAAFQGLVWLVLRGL